MSVDREVDRVCSQSIIAGMNLISVTSVCSWVFTIGIAVVIALKMYLDDSTIPWGAVVAMIGVAIVAISMLPEPDNNQENSDEQ